MGASLNGGFRLDVLRTPYSANENCLVAFLPSGDLPSSFAFVKKISSEFDIPPQRSRLAQMDAIDKRKVTFEKGVGVF